MIRVTRLDGKELWVNADQILTVEATPDTVLLLHGGLHLMVREPPEEVVDRTVAYRRRIAVGPFSSSAPGPERRASLVPLPRPPTSDPAEE
ncbi:MAG TPA: flagellar FlbD family protein [Anaeromyxobacter sp.]|nr:flagellar FlbD family protein [Anaeromyxobacter sp.]